MFLLYFDCFVCVKFYYTGLLKNTTNILDDILSEGLISDMNLRMLVKKILIHQNNDKSLDIRFEMNGEFNPSCSVFVEPEDETA